MRRRRGPWQGDSHLCPALPGHRHLHRHQCCHHHPHPGHPPLLLAWCGLGRDIEGNAQERHFSETIIIIMITMMNMMMIAIILSLDDQNNFDQNKWQVSLLGGCSNGPSPQSRFKNMVRFSEQCQSDHSVVNHYEENEKNDSSVDDTAHHLRRSNSLYPISPGHLAMAGVEKVTFP